MKQYNKLFAILFAVLGVTTSAMADTSILLESEGWKKITEMPTNIEDYYYALVDNTQDLMLTMAVGANQGSSYYTMYYKTSQNPLQNKAALWTIEGTNYTFRNAEYTTWAMQTEWGAAWNYRTHDQANACEWTATVPAYSLTDLCWTIQNGKYPDSGYLGPWNNTVVDGAEVACNKTGDAIGKFQIYAIHKTYCVDVLAENATPTNPVDMTVLLANVNADLPVVGMGGWTTANTIARNPNNGYDGKGGFFEFCNWSSTTGWKGSMSQSLSNLPNGKYIVKAAAQAETDVNLTLTANGESVTLTCKGDKEGTLGYQGWEYIQVECLVKYNTLEISATSSATTNSKWANIDDFTLTYLGPDIDALKEELTTALTKAKDMVTNSDELAEGAKTEFTAAITKAEADTEAATTAKAINEILSDLEIARQAYVYKAEPINGTYFDFTFKMNNAAVASADGWTNAGTYNREYYNGAPDNTFLDSNSRTEDNGDMYQEVTGLPGGLYTLTATGRAATACTSAYIYLNDTKAEITNKIGNTGGELGQGWNRYTTAKTSVSGNARIGFKSVTVGNWAGADDFRLYYYGFDPASAQNTVSTLKAEAESLTSKPMNADVAAKLNEAIDQADATAETRNELNAMIGALETAIAAAKTSISDYEKIATYISKANTIDVSIAAEYKTAYDNRTLAEDAVSVFQALEVATYNYVIVNYSYEVPLSNEWESTGEHTQAADFSNEHWSGETRTYKNQEDKDDKDGNKQGWNAQAWSINFEQDVTLPAGDYVFKVAGRKSDGATLKLVAKCGDTELGTVEDFPSMASGLGLGINKEGAASFDANDPIGFAKNGQGFGWQWRYVKFTLDAENTVTIAVNAEASVIHQWVSFGDYTLQMSEDTYLEANMDGLIAPTAAAEALVDTKPMGTSENEALKTALDMPVERGADLLAKIEALNTAVANAKNWVADYNAKKVALVDALERFEADYNDAENGALDHMCKSRWTTAISMAQAAAMAKDVTNSYEGFEQAANNLIAALDAATISIGEYADLDEAIKKAQPLYEGDNWGSQPFQMPISAKDGLNTENALAVYDKAEADGEDVTDVTKALNNGINTPLNAPEEGQRFYIKVATEGHGKYGNAVLAALGNTGDNNPTGYGLNANNAVKPYLNQAFVFTQVEGNLYNISIERPEGTVYLTYGSLNGSAAGWKNQQIQATTDESKKGEFKIVPTAKKNIIKIYNTVDNNYLDCQDSGSIYTDTGIEKEEFTFELASESTVTLKFSSVGWATLILPFDAELPDGVTAYSCGEANGDVLTLTEAESLKANTPYLMNSYGTEFTFSGYGLADKDSYTDGLFTGTYVNYTTTANSNTYVLQNNNGEVAFYLVGESAQPTVKPYRCYMTYEAAAGAPKFRIGRNQGSTTGIDNVNVDSEIIIYDLTGRKVTTIEKGGMYIVNGKKVYVK